MKIIRIGSGPAGLYFALLIRLQDPSYDIMVVKCNRPYDVFGWGVVSSDQTLGSLQRADIKSTMQVLGTFNHRDDTEVYTRGQVVCSGGYGFYGIGHKRLLNILQTCCKEGDVKLVFETDIQDDMVHADADLIIVSDGLNNCIRTKYTVTYQPDIDTHRCRFVWFDTHKPFEALMFAFEETEHGWFQAHTYRPDDETSTSIVEAPEEVWRAAGLETMEKEDVIVYCERLFAKYLDGNELVSNATYLRGSAQWIRFPRVICRYRVYISVHGTPVVPMSDVTHTTHSSIDSGTKLALGDSTELVRSIGQYSGNLHVVLKYYGAICNMEVLHIQNAARNSMEQSENVARYANLPVEQSAYSLLTRSQHTSHEDLCQCDRHYLEQSKGRTAEQADARRGLQRGPMPPMLMLFTVRDVTLKNRVVVLSMVQYSYKDGQPVDYHLVHLDACAMSGTGLMMAEMTRVSPDVRITPGCPGSWNTDQHDGWTRIVQLMYASSDARLGIQLSHADTEGSTRVAWEGIDLSLEDGQNQSLISASPRQYLDGVSQQSRTMTRDDMDRVHDDFVHSARLATGAGFDWLELHCVHDYLLSSFISSLMNQRNDERGGSLENRLRFLLGVFHVVHEVWPSNKLMSIRISAHDWVEGDITPDDAVEITHVFETVGADMIDCSSGQVGKKEQSAYGRVFQAPFAGHVRNGTGIATIVAGAISETDHVNGIIVARHTDLCAVTRPHLANPTWTLNGAARIGHLDIP